MILNMLVTSIIIAALINLLGGKPEKIAASMMPIPITIIYTHVSQDLSAGLAVVMTMMTPPVAIIFLSMEKMREMEAEDGVTSTTGSGTGS